MNLSELFSVFPCPDLFSLLEKKKKQKRKFTKLKENQLSSHRRPGSPVDGVGEDESSSSPFPVHNNSNNINNNGFLSSPTSAAASNKNNVDPLKG
jgi:hypothetical protein